MILASGNNLALGTNINQPANLQQVSGKPITEPITGMPVGKYIPAKVYKGKPDWYVYFSYEYPDAEHRPEGKRLKRFIKKGGFNRTKDKKQKEQQFQALASAYNYLMKNGWSPFHNDNLSTPDDMEDKNLLFCLDYVLNVKKVNIRRRSYESYKDTIRVFREYLKAKKLEYIYPKMLTVPIVIGFGDYMLNEKKYAGKTFNTHRTALSIFLGELKNRGIITSNPALAIKIQAETTKSHVPFSTEQRAVLKDYFAKNNPRLGYFCQFVYYAYIRPLELLSVRVGDIDLTRRVIVIKGEYSKNRKQQSIYIPDGLARTILDMELHKHSPSDFVFGYQLQTGPKQYSRNRVSETHKDILRALKMSADHNLYSWKHSGVVDAYNLTKDPYKLMRQLRHHSLEMTMRYLRSLGCDDNFTFEMPQF